MYVFRSYCTLLLFLSVRSVIICAVISPMISVVSASFVLCSIASCGPLCGCISERERETEKDNFELITRRALMAGGRVRSVSSTCAPYVSCT